jgi:hypothetical protein
MFHSTKKWGRGEGGFVMVRLSIEIIFLSRELTLYTVTADIHGMGHFGPMIVAPQPTVLINVRWWQCY